MRTAYWLCFICHISILYTHLWVRYTVYLVKEEQLRERAFVMHHPCVPNLPSQFHNWYSLNTNAFISTITNEKYCPQKIYMYDHLFFSPNYFEGTGCLTLCFLSAVLFQIRETILYFIHIHEIQKVRTNNTFLQTLYWWQTDIYQLNVLNKVCEGLQNLRWGWANLCLTSFLSAILTIKMIEMSHTYITFIAYASVYMLIFILSLFVYYY